MFKGHPEKAGKDQTFRDQTDTNRKTLLSEEVQNFTSMMTLKITGYDHSARVQGEEHECVSFQFAVFHFNRKNDLPENLASES